MKQTPLRQVSKKRAVLNVKRRKFVKEFLEENPECEAKLPGCTYYATDVHESILRAHQGAIIPGEKADAQGQTFHALCRTDHSAITDATGELRQWCLNEGLIQLKFRAEHRT